MLSVTGAIVVICCACGFLALMLSFAAPSEEILRGLAAQLQRETDMLLLKFPTHTNAVPREDWPPTIAKLSPSKVYACREGLYLRFGGSFTTEHGVFILRDPSDFVPRWGTDPSYRPVVDRIYMYYIAG